MRLSDQFNNVLNDLGDYGPYQKRAFFLLALSTVPTGYHAYSQVLLSYEPKFACATAKGNYDFDTDNFTLYQDLTVPDPESLNKTEEAAQCFTFDFGANNYSTADDVRAVTKNMDPVTCEAEEWIFDTSEFESTATTEWGNVCDRKQLNTFDTQSFMIGKLVGAFIFGAMSDAIGRFKTYFISLTLQLVCGVIIAIAPNIIIYSISRLAIGATCSGVYLCAYVLALEFVGPDNRTTPGLIYPMFYAVGYALLAPIGYFVKDFRTISWILAVPSVFFIPYYFFMDESVQWLLTKKRLPDAEKIVLKAAKYNKKNLPSPIFVDDGEALAESKGQCDGFISMFTAVGKVFTGPYPKLRVRFLALFALWFINSGSYYGLTLNTKNLGGNFYLNFVIGALIEIPAIGAIILMVQKWDMGRRQILMGTYFLCGALNLLVAILQGIADDPSKDPWKTAILVLAMGGKFAISGAYAVVYLFSTEQFPTVIKNSGLGICSFTARIGGLLCPYVIMTNDLWKPLPLLIFGCVAVVAGCLMFLLPETHKKQLPTTLEEGERFGGETTEPKNLEEGEKLNN